MTDNVPAKMESAAVVHPIEKYWSLEQAKIIQSVVAPNLTSDELIVFAYMCNKANLDPFAKQIYAIKRGGKMCVQTAIDGFRLIAERTGKYAPGNDTEFLYTDKGQLLGGKVFVKKLTADGIWHNVSATALLSEYNAGSGLWRKMPHVMIEKCAEARALRRAFPADLSGLYSDDEMDQADSKPPPSIAPNEPCISAEKARQIDEYINGDNSIRAALLTICQVKAIDEIKESQLEACKKYVRTRKKKIEDENMDDETVLPGGNGGG